MVWIFGGGFTFGQASMYGPDFFMKEDVVVVTINYRVGALGFMSIDDSNQNIPGNAGLKDQTLAMRWVKQNIVKFGGDPDNITLFGESAGGASVNYHMISDYSKNLFHKAIIQSGSVFAPWALSKSSDMAPRLATKLGWNGQGGTAAMLNVLMAAHPSDIVAQQDVSTIEEQLLGNMFAFAPTIEKYDAGSCFMKKHPNDLIDQAWGKSVTLLVGGNSGEGFLFYKLITDKTNAIGDPDLLQKVLSAEIADKYPLNSPMRLMLADKVKTFYNLEMPLTHANVDQIIPVLTDRFFWHGISKHVRSRLDGLTLAAPTIIYHFDYNSPVLLFFKTLYAGEYIPKVMHAEELVYLWNLVGVTKEVLLLEDKWMSNTIVHNWATFAKTGNPNTPDTASLNWQPIQKTDSPMKCLSFDRRLSVIDLPESDAVRFWNEILSYGL